MSKDTDLLDVLIVGVGALLIVVILSFISGWIIQMVWNAIATQMFPTLPYMPYWIAYGIAIVIGMFRPSSNAKSS